MNLNRKQFIYLEEMSEGKFRLTYTKNTISDISKLKSIEIVRE